MNCGRAAARRARLARAAEELIRIREPGAAIGLIELTGEDGALAPRADLAACIQTVLASRGGAGALAADFGGGRFGLLPGEGMPDLGAIAGHVALLLAQHGLPGRIGTRTMALGEQALNPVQATRALRFALSAFARGGDAALAKAGFEGGLSGFVASAAERAAALGRTIAERRFRLAFQPIVLLADRQAHHYEALLRPIPTPGTPYGEASEFIALAETVGLSEALDWAVVETACEAARAAGTARIACNLSGRSLQSPASGNGSAPCCDEAELAAGCWWRSPRPPRSRTRPRRHDGGRPARLGCPSASTISAPAPPPSGNCAPSAWISSSSTASM